MLETIAKKLSVVKRPAFEKEGEALELPQIYRIQNVGLPNSGEKGRWYHLDITPVSDHEGLAKYMDESQAFNSKIRFMNERQYEEIFERANPQDIVGQMIEVGFVIPNRWYKDYHGCSQHQVNRIERREIYTPEFKVAEKPITVVSIKPDCGHIHVAPSSWGQSHYYLKMLFDGDKFDEMKWLFDAQKEEYSEKGDSFPKMKLPVELRSFDFLKE